MLSKRAATENSNSCPPHSGEIRHPVLNLWKLGQITFVTSELLGARHIQILTGFTAAFLSYTLRVNLSVAVVGMRSTPSKSVTLTATDEGFLSSAFFYSYILALTPGAALVNKFKPRVVLTASAILSGLVTLAFPPAYYYTNFTFLCFLRVLLGLFEAPCFPCISALVAKWSLRNERGRFMSFTLSGLHAGSSIMFLVGGHLASGTGSWMSIFYVSGCVSIVWGIVSYFIVCDSVEENKFLSADEKSCLQNDHKMDVEAMKMKPVPWVRLLSSVPVWCMMLVGFAEDYCSWTILSLLPTLLNGVFNYDIAKDGTLTALASFCTFVSSLTLPFISDYVASYFLLSLDTSRKLWNSVALYTGSVIFLVLALCSLDSTAALTLLMAFSVLIPGVYSGYQSNSVDLAPNYAHILTGLLSSVGSTGSCLASTLGGILVQDYSDRSQWSTLFLIIAAMAFIGNTIYLIFGSSKIQPWN